MFLLTIDGEMKIKEENTNKNKNTKEGKYK